jgi:hypothetical protein
MSGRHVVTRVASNSHMKGVRFGVFRKTHLCVSPTNSDSHVRSCTRDMEQCHPTKDTVVIHHDSWSDGEGVISSHQDFFFFENRTSRPHLRSDCIATCNSSIFSLEHLINIPYTGQKVGATTRDGNELERIYTHLCWTGMLSSYHRGLRLLLTVRTTKALPSALINTREEKVIPSCYGFPYHHHDMIFIVIHKNLYRRLHSF